MAKGKSAEWLTEDGLLILKGLARDGCSDKQIYERIGISKQTFYDWCKKFPDFSDTIKKGREPVKVKVEDAFYSRCDWREVTETRKEVFVDSSGKESKKVVNQTRWIPPDTGALIFALKNLDHKKWQDKPQDNDSHLASDKDFEAMVKALRGETSEDT